MLHSPSRPFSLCRFADEHRMNRGFIKGSSNGINNNLILDFLLINQEIKQP